MARRLFALGFAAFAVASSAEATTVIATLTNNSPISVTRTILTGASAPQNYASIGVSRFVMDRTGGTDTRILAAAAGMTGGDFLAFCIEPRETISVGVSVTWDAVTLENAASNLGGIGSTKADQIRELFGRHAPRLATPMTALQQAALQVAIWEVVRETPNVAFNINTGNIFYAGETVVGVLALAQTYVQSIDGAGPRATNLIGLRNVGAQDLIVQTTVPEPLSWSLMIAGFGLVGWQARRQRRIASAAA